MLAVIGFDHAKIDFIEQDFRVHRRGHTDDLMQPICFQRDLRGIMEIGQHDQFRFGSQQVAELVRVGLIAIRRPARKTNDAISPDFNGAKQRLVTRGFNNRRSAIGQRGAGDQKVTLARTLRDQDVLRRSIVHGRQSDFQLLVSRVILTPEVGNIRAAGNVGELANSRDTTAGQIVLHANVTELRPFH